MSKIKDKHRRNKTYISVDLLSDKSDRANQQSVGVPTPVKTKRSTGYQRAIGLFRGWREILRHHGAPKEVINDCKKQIISYLDTSEESVFFKRAKYIGTMYMAWYLKVEMPLSPPEPFRHSGAWRGWARSRRFLNRKNTHLWYSLLQAKRCALPLSHDMVLATYEKHRGAMENIDPIDPDTLDSVFMEMKPLLKSVRKRLEKSYRTGESLENLSETRWTPSGNAAYEASKADGGQRSALINAIKDRFNVDEFHNSNPSAPVQYRTLPVLSRMEFFPKVLLNGVVRYNQIVEYYDYPYLQENWDDKLCDEILTYNTGEPLKCTIYGILEPLKVRVISKGPAIPYYAAKELQKRLHQILRNYECFRLIGRPLCATDLIDCKNNPVQSGFGDLNWFSIDYSSATDGLSASLSEKTLSYLTKNLPQRMRELWYRVLAPHFCEYPPIKVKIEGKKKEVIVPPVQQTNGQLMGSPLSFPILCLINVGLYLHVSKDDPRSIWKKLRGVLVNGDDMLYVARSSIWDVHVEEGRKVGLEMTPGKAYRHPTFANANSTCFHYDLNDERSSPWQIDFLNTGLFFGQNKVLQKDTGIQEEEISHKVAVINQLLKGALPGKQKLLLKRYLALHTEDIKKECAGRNLFIDESLGGMGVVPPVGWSWDVTQRQRMTATVRAMRLGSHAEFSYGPLTGHAMIDITPEEVAPFHVSEKRNRVKIHEYDRKVKAKETFLKSSLLCLPLRCSSTPKEDWRESFYFPSQVEQSHVRSHLSPQKRFEKDFFSFLYDFDNLVPPQWGDFHFYHRLQSEPEEWGLL